MLRFLTAGESHGPALTVILEGLPAGLKLSRARLDRELFRRQQGYGRGGRMRIEQDAVQVTGGLRGGETLGSPLVLVIRNRDWDQWVRFMDAWDAPASGRRLTRPRPGHADLVGALKYQRTDLRDILERASARETAARVAAGAVAKQLLAAFGVNLGSWVEAIGPAELATADVIEPLTAWLRAAERSDVRCPDPVVARHMRQAIDAASAQGDTLGGRFVVVAQGLVPGLGSHVQWDRRLDGRLSQALMSIPAVKAVEFGQGFTSAGLPGSAVHDVITFKPGQGFGRASNHSGGLEGGMTTGQPLWARCGMKPIATLKRPLASVDWRTKKKATAGVERSDVCAVPAAAVVGEAMVAWTLASAWMEKFGGDSLAELSANVANYQQWLKRA